MSAQRKYAFPESMWAGTDHSLELAMDVHEQMMAGMFDTGALAAPAVEADVPYNFSQQGGVGIVSIKGPLVNNDSEYNRYRGVTSYSDVRRAMIYAATQDSVKAILLDVDSGGGSVSGVDDAGALIASIDKGVKPVYAFTGGQMESAAYWLAVSARGIYVSQTAMVGSIGVIATHKEYSKAFKEAGIGVTVMRAGEHKALVNMLEPLSDAARAGVQSQLNAAYGVFATHVATQLGVSMATFEAKMGQGREFFGAAGVDVGLAKGVKTFDGMVSYVSKQIDIFAKRDNTALNPNRGNMMTRQALTEQRIAALASSGAPLDAAAAALELAAAVAFDKSPEGIAAIAAAKVTADAALALAATQTPEALAAAAETARLAAAAAAPAAENAGVVAFLQSQVKDKDAAFLAQSIELAASKAKNASMEATHAGLVKIAATSVSNMKVGLGLAKVDLSAMAPELLLAEHTTTAEAFAKAFKVGGVAAITPPDLNAGQSTELTAREKAQLEATRFPTQTK